MHWIETVFGTSNLYEILGISSANNKSGKVNDIDNDTNDDTTPTSLTHNITRSALRKAYYRSALEHHPDKPGGDSKRFQAISMAYQILDNDASRTEYDRTGIIPGNLDDNDDEEDDAASAVKVDVWKAYFDRIFGRVTTSKIDAFAQKYKCSDEEQRDVLAACVKCKGNLTKMIDIVLVSEFRDAERWFLDYLQPAMDAGSLPRSYEGAMKKTMKTCQKKAAQQDAIPVSDDKDSDNDDDDNECNVSEDMEESEDEKEQKKQPTRKKSSRKSSALSTDTRSYRNPPQKAGKTNSKPKKSKPSIDNLITAIQSKRSSSGSASVFASLGARYGISMEDDDDPLNGDKFASAQTKMLRNGKNKKKR